MKKKMNLPPQLPKTGCYERLSRQDEGKIESNSIINQKKKNEQYALTHGFTNIVHYTDDGYSGTSFERPAWKQLMQDVESGAVKTVIVKDLSRIGRNYLEVGMITEVIFPQLDVRFIAIDNGVDSINHNSTEFVPIMNVLNE